MYKLSGHSLTKDVWFEPESQGMTLSERDSTTSITLGPDAPEIGFDEWILDNRWSEGNYVWRVKSLGDQTNTETRTTELEHVIKILDDIKLFGEVTTADLAGQSGASTVTAKKAVQYILNKCSDWTLGTFEYDDVSNPYEFNGDSLYDALETITETLEDAVWTYSLGSYPFKLNIIHRSDAVACEMRAGRNLSTLKRQVNRSGMYTRIYPIGKNDLHIDGNYLSKNENLYGRIDQIETDQSKSTKANLRAWAQARLNRHCEPTMTITISGLELSADTGEDLDKLRLNRVCRCPLPKSSTVIDEKIVKLQWRDRLKDPENVTVNLCNSSADVATIIKQQSRGGGKAAAGQAKQNYLFEANGQHLYYEIFDECGHLHGMLEMTSESLRIAFDNEIASTRSEFLMTSESLRIMFENEIASTRSEFEMTSESLRIAFENEIASTRSEFEMTSESLRIQFENDLASTRSEFQMTSESLRIQFENDLASTRSEFQMTSESLRVQFENELSSTRSEFEMTSESMRVHFENEISSTRSEMQMTSESLRIAFEAGQSSLRSEFNMTAASLRIEFQSADSSIRSLVTQTASSWEAKISGVTGSDGKVTAASIAVAINNAGEGVATINASKIYLLGQTIANQITSEYIATAIANIASLGVNAVTGDSAGFNSVYGGNIYFRSSSGSGYATSNIKDIFLSSIEIRGPVNNVYSLYQHTANDATGVLVGTFSRATALSGVWSGGKITVTASPQGETFEELLASGTAEWANDYKSVQIPINATWGSSGQYSESTGWKAYLDTTPAYNAANPASGTASGRHGTTYDWDFIITRGDGTTKALQIDCSAIYTDARSGYTQGTFTLQTITLQGTPTSSLTLQGSAATTSTATLRGTAATKTTVTLQGSATSSLTLQGESQTVYEEVSSGGTVYYTAGTAVTVYPGDGGSFTVQGSAYGDITPIGSAVWFKQHSKTETPTGTWYTYHTSDPGGTTYKRFAAGAVIKGLRNPGTTTKYARGTGYSITPISGTSKRLNSVTRYKAGSNVGVLYNAGTIAEYYPTTETLYKSGSSLEYYPATETLYKAGSNVGILYNAGTIDSTHYYTKS